jgi:hypothetical protein
MEQRSSFVLKYLKIHEAFHTCGVEERKKGEFPYMPPRKLMIPHMPSMFL